MSLHPTLLVPSAAVALLALSLYSSVAAAFLLDNATLIGSSLLLILILGFFMGRVWFTKAVKARRTPGHDEIQTSSADLVDRNEQDDDEQEMFRAPSNRDTWLREQRRMAQQLEDDSKSRRGKAPVDEIPEQRLFMAFSKYSASLTHEAFHVVFQKMDWRHLNAGEVLWARRSKADGIYMVVNGILSQHRPVSVSEASRSEDADDAGPETRATMPDSMMSNEKLGPVVSRYQHGDVLGEIATLTGNVHSSTVIADSKTDVVCISKENFKELLGTQPHVIVSFLRSVMARHWRVAHFVLDEFFCVPVHTSQHRSYSQPLYTTFKGTDAELASISSEVSLASGQIVFAAGSQIRRHLLLLLEGRVCIVPKERGPDSTNSGQALEVAASERPVFGGISFVTGAPHLATVRCLTPCRFAAVSVDDFKANPLTSLVDVIVDICSYMCCLLQQFAELGLYRRWLPAGTVLFNANEFASDVFIVVSGRLRIYSPPSRLRTRRRGDADVKTLLEVGRGECVGEMALLSGDDVHSQSCISVRDSEIVCLPRESFRALEADRAALLKRFASTMAKRLREMAVEGTSAAKGSKVSTIAVIPADDAVALDDFVMRLSEALEFYGSTFHVNHDSMTKMVEEDDTLGRMTSWDSDERMFRSQVAHFLTDLEEEHDFLIFCGDRAKVEWSKCCVRQSDYILVVGNARESPEVSQFEKELLWDSKQTMSLSHKDLVLIHDEKTRLPSGTRHWFHDRRLHAFHHVRVDRPEAYSRLARVICRRTVGVVCSGGGARGLAHMGTFRALKELDVPIDYIAGTSQGAYMAAVYAIHLADKMEPVVRQFAARMGSIWELLRDATLPVISYFSGRKFSESICSDFGPDTHIEDLWIPFFCVTTNLTKADICIHRTGILWKAVRASMSIVDYLPPMYLDGEMLIDGGYIDNLPVDIMKDIHNVDVLIAVDVENKTSPFRNITDYGQYLSGWWLMWLKLKPWILPFSHPIKVPRFSEIVTSLKYMNHARNIRSFLNDNIVSVYIRPELGATMLLDYHRYEEISELGYRFTKEAVSRWVLQNRSLVNSLRGYIGRQNMSSPNLQRKGMRVPPQRHSSGGLRGRSPRLKSPRTNLRPANRSNHRHSQSLADLRFATTSLSHSS